MRAGDGFFADHGPRGPGSRPIRPGRPAVRTIDARRVEADGRSRPQDFTYTVTIAPQPVRPAADRRQSPRKRTRLRSGKLVDIDGRFITECLIHDLSALGGRLRLPPGLKLPAVVQIFDDQSGLLHLAKLLWRRGSDAGVRFIPRADTPESRATANEMRRRLYKVQW